VTWKITRNFIIEPMFEEQSFGWGLQGCGEAVPSMLAPFMPERAAGSLC